MSENRGEITKKKKVERNKETLLQNEKQERLFSKLYIQLPSREWMVAWACKGKRYRRNETSVSMLFAIYTLRSIYYPPKLNEHDKEKKIKLKINK